MPAERRTSKQVLVRLEGTIKISKIARKVLKTKRMNETLQTGFQAAGRILDDDSDFARCALSKNALFEAIDGHTTRKSLSQTVMNSMPNEIGVGLGMGVIENTGSVGADGRHITLERPRGFGDPLGRSNATSRCVGNRSVAPSCRARGCDESDFTHSCMNVAAGSPVNEARFDETGSNPYLSMSFCMRGLMMKLKNFSAASKDSLRQVDTTASPN